MLVSFKNDETLKKLLLTEVTKHRKAEQIIQGTYGEGAGKEWKGCAVGCSIHSLNLKLGKDYDTGDHTVYEKELGLPEWLARLEDTIFEGLPTEQAKLWPERFIKAIPVGVNLETVKWKFCAFILKENIERVLSLNISDDLKKQVVDSVRGVLKLHEDAIVSGKWDESAAAAWSAAWTARSAESAEWSARSAEWSAAWSAESAAWSAAWTARSAEWSARSAAAARSAESAAAESAAESAARSAYERYADYLIDLLKKA